MLDFQIFKSFAEFMTSLLTSYWKACLMYVFRSSHLYAHWKTCVAWLWLYGETLHGAS